MNHHYNLSDEIELRMAVKAQTSPKAIALYKKVIKWEKKCHKEMLDFYENWEFLFGIWLGVHPRGRACRRSDWVNSDINEKLWLEFKSFGAEYIELVGKLSPDDISRPIFATIFINIKKNCFSVPAKKTDN